MQCPQCRHENPPQAKFCLECGAGFAVACAQCGTQLPVGAKFCLECGKPTDSHGIEPARFTSPQSYTPKHLAEKILTSKSALEGERKQVTVLFADLKGSMELLADRDPEEARKLLDPVLEHMMEAVHRYEGTVNQVMGDGIMALFGAPLAHEDHAVRACYAALRMQESVKRYAEGVFRSFGVPIHIRVGMNSGEVVVRAIGSDLHMDYTAVGQSTHLAARMEQMAQPGTILLTPETLALAEGFVQVTSRGSVPVKGLATPIEIFELAGASLVRSRLHAAASRGLTRFVGRDAEIELLRQALGRAGEGHGQLVAVVGEPGVGKSRLVWEFTHSHRSRGWLVLEAASVSYGKATTYFPVIELLRGYFGIESRDDGRKMREKVTGKLLSLERALEPTLPVFLSLLDVRGEDPEWAKLDPAQRRRQTLEALKRLLVRESQVQPVLLVVEDLHWIDGDTQAWLDLLVESLPTARLLLLTNYRPEYSHGWGSKTYYQQVRLDTLPATSAGELLEALLGTGPGLEALERLLIERTQGNPFFLEESVRALVETRALTGERGAYRLAGPIQRLQLPATAQAILAARIDRLAPADKRLLQAAAVVGKDVPFPLLQAIAEEPEEGVRQSLTRLQAAEFLYEARLFPELEYTFKHALTHEVTYGGLLQERRRVLHARILGAMEHLHANHLDEHLERLAHHAFLGEVWDKAVGYLYGAGQKAAARSAFRDASLHMERALVAARHLPDTREHLERTCDLSLDRGGALFALSEVEASLASVREAETIAVALGDERRLGRIWNSLAIRHWIADEPMAGLDLGERVLALAAARDDIGLQVPAQEAVGRCCFSLGRYRRAVSELSGNVAVLEGTLVREHFGSNLLRSVAARWLLVWCHAEIGEFPEADTRAAEAIRIAEAAANPHSVVAAYTAVGYSTGSRGDSARSVPALETAMSICQESNIAIWLPVIEVLLACMYALGGRPADAMEVARRASARRGTPGVMRTRLIEAYVLAGDLDRARVLAHRALEDNLRSGLRGAQAWGLRFMGEIAAAEAPQNAGVAVIRYQEALALADELGMRPLVAHCHLGLGTLSRRTGKREQAQAHLTTATMMYREMDMRFYLEQAETALVDLR